MLQEVSTHVSGVQDPSIARFALEASDSTRTLWPHEFELILDIKLYADKLTTALHVTNNSGDEISFQVLQHTYLSVDDVRNGGCRVEGLRALPAPSTYIIMVSRVNTRHILMTFAAHQGGKYEITTWPLCMSTAALKLVDHISTIFYGIFSLQEPNSLSLLLDDQLTAKHLHPTNMATSTMKDRNLGN